MLQFVKYVFELNQVEKKTDGIFITFTSRRDTDLLVLE